MKKDNTKVGYSKLSFSVPWWLAPMVKERARGADQTLSQYIRALVRNDIGEAKVASKNTVSTQYD